MKKYKVLGITKYAERHLNVDDCECLIEMIGCIVLESQTLSHLDGGVMLEMPDGEITHICFLQLEEIQEELNFE